jgi:hypothetical protein
MMLHATEIEALVRKGYLPPDEREDIWALKARFAAVRVRTADGPPQRIWDMGQQHMPGDEDWLIGEQRTE